MSHLHTHRGSADQAEYFTWRFERACQLEKGGLCSACESTAPEVEQLLVFQVADSATVRALDIICDYLQVRLHVHRSCRHIPQPISADLAHSCQQLVPHVRMKARQHNC